MTGRWMSWGMAACLAVAPVVGVGAETSGEPASTTPAPAPAAPSSAPPAAVSQVSPVAEAYTRGLDAFQAGRLDEAVRAWQEAVTLDPGCTDAHVGLGVIHLKRGQLAQAEAAFQRVLAKDPHHVNALSNLGTVAMQRGQYVVAVSYYRKAVERDPTDASLWVDLATCYATADDLEAARAAALNALAFDPGSAEAQALVDRLDQQLALPPAPPTRSGAAADQ